MARVTELKQGNEMHMVQILMDIIHLEKEF